MTTPVDSPDDLYGLPLDEFTAARNRLAKETGDKAIAKLKKPSATAWALNQAARAHKGDVARFLHAAERVRTGGGREALRDLREAEADVRRAAGADPRAVNDLLAAAAADADVADRLRRGVLTGGEEPGGDVSSLFAPGPAPAPDEVRAARRERAGARARHPSQRAADTRAARKQADEAAKDARRREEARRRLEEAEAAARELAREADRLEREAAEAQDKAAKARARADAARQKADELRHA